MTDRLPQISARIDGISQLETVVNAMRSIAAARARQARAELDAVGSYATTIATAIGRVLALAPPQAPPPTRRGLRTALVVFCAEQGFVGAFNQHLWDTLGTVAPGTRLFVVGTRGVAVGEERGARLFWKSPMPARSGAIPALADRIARAIYGLGSQGAIDRVETVFGRWPAEGELQIEHRSLVPIAPERFAAPAAASPPLLNLAPAVLLSDFTAEYLHAQLCSAALHAFAAESEARLQTLGQAREHIRRRLAELRQAQQSVRQEEITAEIIELAAGESAARPGAVAGSTGISS